ncbi:hypothetical protein EYF80_055976 [Liparis tanakae]|uniref:Uncharacterized protein n=1 Tax=Liparis tanakae TaxID=230148 RepID=A0A4Z2EYL7_9TELE|nr:hypothetical protein EYF80_055976 [Liparis tanakae]
MSLPRPSDADHGVRALLEQFSREDDAPSTEVPSPSLQGSQETHVTRTRKPIDPRNPSDPMNKEPKGLNGPKEPNGPREPNGPKEPNGPNEQGTQRTQWTQVTQ